MSRRVLFLHEFERFLAGDGLDTGARRFVTENSLTMRAAEPTFAVLSRCVPPQNSTE